VGLPDKTKRWCTEELKVLAMFWHIYLNIFETPDDLCLVNIGYRADEAHRWLKIQGCKENRVRVPMSCPVDGKHSRVKHHWQEIEYRIPNAPMVAAGVDVLDVMKFWAEEGWQWPFVSNCGHCFYHSDEELQHVAKTSPEIIDWAISKEHQRGARWDSKRTLTQRISAEQSLLFPHSEFACFCTD
jgi:hypothetical protein